MRFALFRLYAQLRRRDKLSKLILKIGVTEVRSYLIEYLAYPSCSYLQFKKNSVINSKFNDKKYLISL